ncbi:hypothetical protein IJ670_05290 [bacterium]|nr:hypothetical protein [bacterium]
MTESLNSVDFLHSKLDYINSKQGCIGKLCNGIKETVNAGVTNAKCETMLAKYDNGEISFEEALECLESYENKQKTSSGLVENILTGLGSIAVTTLAAAGGPITLPLALLYGGTSGAAIKTVLGITDRATNNIQGDDFDKKEILKDAISGGTTGTTSAVSSHIFQGVKEAKIGVSLLNGAKCGVECGTASGAVSYLTDCALDENKKFDFGELTSQTLTSGFVSGTVGTLVGGCTYGLESLAGNIGKEASLSVGQTIARDGALSSTRKVLAQGEKNFFML